MGKISPHTQTELLLFQCVPLVCHLPTAHLGKDVSSIVLLTSFAGSAIPPAGSPAPHLSALPHSPSALAPETLGSWLVVDAHILDRLSYFPRSCWPSLLLGTPLANGLLPVCLQTCPLSAELFPTLDFFPSWRKGGRSSLVWDFAFVLAKFSVKAPAGPALQPAGMTDQPSSIVTGPSHISVSSAKLMTKHCVTSSRLLIDTIREKTACWGTPRYHFPGSAWPINHLNGNKVDLAEDRNNNSTVMMLHAITF